VAGRLGPSGKPVSIAAPWRRGLWKSDAPPVPKSVGACLAEYANEDGEVWPSTQKLARGRTRQQAGSAKKDKHTSLSRRTVIDALAWLVDHGWLTKVAERVGTTTKYRLTFPPGVFEDVTGLAPVQEAGGVQELHRGVHLLQGGVQELQGGCAAGAPEVDFEVEQEGVQEVGHDQLELGKAQLRDVPAPASEAVETDVESDEERARHAAELREQAQAEGWGA
jgi:hypothetical protein